MDYHIFKKPTKSKNKIVHRWYYYFNDPVTGKKIQKVCKGCKTQAEAYTFISKLPPLFAKRIITIKDIAKWMFVPGSDHLERMAMLGKTYDSETLKIKRFNLNIIIEQFGGLELQELTIPMVINFLSSDWHSGSWKNNFLTVVKEIYAEAPYYGLPYIPVPKFPQFKRNSVKKDIFTTKELNILFDENLWIELSRQMYEKQAQYDEGHEAIFLMFLCSAKCGLRIGEAIGLHVNQFLFEQKMLVIDGFFKHTTKVRTNYNKCGSEDDQKIRVVPLPDDFIPLIKNYIAEQKLSADDYVFYRYGKPIRKCLAEKWFKRAVEISGIDVGKRILTPHSLRFTYVTRMRRNVAGETVMKLAGHTAIEMTDYYTRAGIPELVEVAKPALQAANMLFE